MSSREEKQESSACFSFIPMSKRAASCCAWLFTISLWHLGSGWQCALSTWSWQVPACLVWQVLVLTEVLCQKPFCSGSERQPARREFSLWSCGGGRVWWGDRYAWIAGHTRDRQIFSHRYVFAGDGRAHQSGQTFYHSLPNCNWKAFHLRVERRGKQEE